MAQFARRLWRLTTRKRLDEWGARLLQIQEKLRSDTVRIARWIDSEGKDVFERSRALSRDLEVQRARIETLAKEIQELRLVSKNSLALVRKVSPHLMAAFEEELAAGGKFRELHLTQIWPGVEKVELPISCINEASRHLNHINLLYVIAVAKFLKARRVFEFGTWLGKTTYHLAGSTPETRVFTLDLPPDLSASGLHQGHFFRQSERASCITELHSNSKSFDPAPYAGQMDFIFVDGDHTYEGVEADTKSALQLLAPGGVILWDDFDAKNPDVIRYLTEFSKQRPLFKIANTCLVAYIDGTDAEMFREAPWDFPADWKQSKQKGQA